jgi:hypothetical protein
MPKTQEEAQPTRTADGDSAQSAALAAHVLGALGCPAGLYGVQVRRLWGDHYRVNVFVGDNPAALSLAHSFFLAVGADGRVGSSDPKIKREYPGGKDTAARILP